MIARRLNARGQMHMMEAITSAVLIFVALLTISSLYTGSHNNGGEGGEDGLLVRDTLSLMASEDSGEGRNTLDYYISAGNISGLLSDLDSRLPDTVCFNIYIMDGNSAYLLYYFHAPTGESDTESVLVTLGPCTITDLLTGNNISLAAGTYRIALVTWEEPRNLDEMVSRIGSAPEEVPATSGSMDLSPEIQMHNDTSGEDARPLPLPPLNYILGSTAVAFAAGIAIGAALSDAGRYRFSTLLAPLAYSRLKEEDLLNNATRQEIYRVIEENPGITYSDLLGEVGIGRGTLLYHLERLEKEEYIRSWRDGLYRRFAAYGEKKPDPILADMQKLILRVVAENPGISKTGIARLAGTSRQNIQHHIARLADMGLIRIEKEGRRSRVYLGET